jgi:hypothetical protein
LSPSFATFTAFGLDGPADKMTIKQSITKKEYGFKELQDASVGSRARRSFPRLVLDAATDNYVLDNIGEPSNFQKKSMPEIQSDSNVEIFTPNTGHTSEDPVVPHITENLLLNTCMPTTEEFNYDCFQVSPGADSPKGNFVFHGCDSSQSPTPTKGHDLNDEQSLIKPPIAALANHHPPPNVSSLMKPGNPGSLPRSVRFSPASFSISPPPAQRSLPSIERSQDHLAPSRQKQNGRWKVVRRATPHQVSPYHSSMDMASAQSQTRSQPGMRLPSSSQPTATHVEYSGNEAGSHITIDPKGAGRIKTKVPRAMALLLGVYRPREQPTGSTRANLKYVIAAIASQASLPDGKMPRFAPEFEEVAFNPPLDEVLCQFCIIFPAILFTVPVDYLFYVLQYLENTRIGAAIINFFKALFSAFVSVVIAAFAQRDLRIVAGYNVKFFPKNTH